MSDIKKYTTITQEISSKDIIEVESTGHDNSLDFAKKLQTSFPDSEILVDCDEDSFLVRSNFKNKTQIAREITQPSDLKIDGLIPFIAVDPEGIVLMQAFGNDEALSLTIDNRFAHYFSRSRNKIWKKGEESGMTQKVSKIFYLEKTPAVIFQTGKIPSCHTGFYSCYYRKLNGNSFLQVYPKKEFDPKKIYEGK